MARFFADPQVQSTCGARGKTTGRKSTRTVCGCEEAWIAQCKEELGPKIPQERVGWRVYDEAHHPKWPNDPAARASAYSHTYDTPEKAEEHAARLRRISGTAEANGWVYDVVRVEEYRYTVLVYANRPDVRAD